MFYVYLLKSIKDNNYYIGQTKDITNRLKEHNSGRVRSTKARIPFKLVGYEEYKMRRESMFREYEIKHNVSIKKKFIAKIENEKKE